MKRLLLFALSTCTLFTAQIDPGQAQTINKSRQNSNLEKEIDQERKKVLSELEAKKSQAARNFNEKVNNIQKRYSHSDKIQDRLLKQAYTDYKKTEASLVSKYQKKADQLILQKKALKNRTSSREKMRIVPGLSGLRVRNYENLGDPNKKIFIPNKPPLKAVPKKLK